MNLILGTAQLGMPYGAVNRTGKPPAALAVAIVRKAIAEGVTTIDTARAYGDAEWVIREALGPGSTVQVITKLHLPLSLNAEVTPEKIRAEVDESIAQSCRVLGTNHLQIVLLHNWQQYTLGQGIAWQRLVCLQEEGKINALGASVYEPCEVFKALEDRRITHLQLPMNVLDWRWKAAGVDRALAQRPDVVVHGRSALLQGILPSGFECWPPVADFDPAACVRQLTDLTHRFKRESKTDLCLAYVRSQIWLGNVVVGCETLQQLDENVRLFRLAKLSADQCAEIEASLPRAPEILLNPAKWSASD